MRASWIGGVRSDCWTFPCARDESTGHTCTAVNDSSRAFIVCACVRQDRNTDTKSVSFESKCSTKRSIIYGRMSHACDVVVCRFTSLLNQHQNSLYKQNIKLSCERCGRSHKEPREGDGRYWQKVPFYNSGGSRFCGFAQSPPSHEQ